MLALKTIVTHAVPSVPCYNDCYYTYGILHILYATYLPATAATAAAVKPRINA